MNENVIKATITEGSYKGKPLEVQFGKPMKILCAGKDITNDLLALTIQFDVYGHVVYLKLIENNYSQVPHETLEKMTSHESVKLEAIRRILSEGRR